MNLFNSVIMSLNFFVVLLLLYNEILFIIITM